MARAACPTCRICPVTMLRLALILGGAAALSCSSTGRDGATSFDTDVGTGGSPTGGSTGTDGTGFDVTGEPTGDGASTGMNCGESSFVFVAVPPNVMLVLDKSGSMLTVWDQDGMGGADGTRWNSLYNVVDFVATTFDSTINLGAVLFPSTDAVAEFGEGACTTNTSAEVPVGAMNSAAVLGGIPGPNATTIVGATPATRGMQTAIDELSSLDPTIPRVAILVTDGAANCSADADLSDCPSAGPGCELMELYDDNLVALIGDALTNDDISTFVVGIDITDELAGVGIDGAPEANTFDELNAVAVAGGQARPGDEKFYNSQNEIELQTALEEIASQVVVCTVPLTPEPDAPQFVEIEIEGEIIPQVSDCATEDGWVYVNPSGPYDAIELCGTACGRFGIFGTLDAIYGCPPPE